MCIEYMYRIYVGMPNLSLNPTFFLLTGQARPGQGLIDRKKEKFQARPGPGRGGLFFLLTGQARPDQGLIDRKKEKFQARPGPGRAWPGPARPGPE